MRKFCVLRDLASRLEILHPERQRNSAVKYGGNLATSVRTWSEPPIIVDQIHKLPHDSKSTGVICLLDLFICVIPICDPIFFLHLLTDLCHDPVYVARFMATGKVNDCLLHHLTPFPAYLASSWTSNPKSRYPCLIVS